MRTDLFDYPLPPDRIAQEPAPERDSSRLMVVERATGEISHRLFRDLPELLAAGDCLVVNNSRVFPGRLEGKKENSGGTVELLLLERPKPDAWLVIAKGAALREGTKIVFGEGDLAARVLRSPRDGKLLVRFEAPGDPSKIEELVFDHGKVPLPPYIKKEISDPERYQTVYAAREISAAAPTAGLHFTDELIQQLKGGGVRFAHLELAVGLDTFIPVREKEVEDHVIHSEWFAIDRECASAANGAKEAGCRVIAVGTTSVRALESCAGTDCRVSPGSGRTELFITPGYEFRAVDALITNFHFPRSTLLMLVCAFGGFELVMRAYREAVAGDYRFYSFGDAMLVI